MFYMLCMFWTLLRERNRSYLIGPHSTPVWLGLSLSPFLPMGNWHRSALKFTSQLATVELGFEPCGQTREPFGRTCWKQMLGSLCLLTWLLIGNCHRSVPWGNRLLGLILPLPFEGTVVPGVWNYTMNLRGLLLFSACRFHGLGSCFTWP